jgi:hypothetical protein
VVLGDRFVVKFAWSRSAALRLAREIGVRLAAPPITGAPGQDYLRDCAIRPSSDNPGPSVDNPAPGVFVCLVNVMAAVSIAVCWFLFAAVWLITANYNETRAPAQRQRSWYGTGAIPVLIISFAIRLAVPARTGSR